ncbi:hypothetical protein HWV62_22195 [Athelia sp. TMB]|nr:hypothetical protein HWV62_22195 [Athelia sp. TMB]
MAKETLVGYLKPLLLRSSHLEDVLDVLRQGFQWRYLALPRISSEKELQDAKDAVARSHEWMMDTLQMALKNAAWQASLDQAVQQELAYEKPEKTRKRKSHYSEYDMSTQVRKKYQASARIPEVPQIRDEEEEDDQNQYLELDYDDYD